MKILLVLFIISFLVGCSFERRNEVMTPPLIQIFPYGIGVYDV